MRRDPVFVIILLILLGSGCATAPAPTPTAAPTATPPPPTATPVPVTYETFDSELLGFSMTHPDDWIVEANEENGAVTFSSELGLLQAQELPEDGALVAVLFIEDGLLDSLLPAGADPQRTDQLGVLDLVQPLFFQPEDGVRQETDPREISINDAPAAQVNLATGINAQEAHFTLTTFGAQEQVVAVLTGTPAANLDTYRPILETMVNSIMLAGTEP